MLVEHEIRGSLQTEFRISATVLNIVVTLSGRGLRRPCHDVKKSSRYWLHCFAGDFEQNYSVPSMKLRGGGGRV